MLLGLTIVSTLTRTLTILVLPSIVITTFPYFVSSVNIVSKQVSEKRTVSQNFVRSCQSPPLKPSPSLPLHFTRTQLYLCATLTFTVQNQTPVLPGASTYFQTGRPCLHQFIPESAPDGLSGEACKERYHTYLVACWPLQVK